MAAASAANPEFMHLPKLGGFQVKDPGVAVLSWDSMSIYRHDRLRPLAQEFSGTDGTAAQQH